MKKIVSFILALILLLCTACSNQANTNSSNTSSTNQNTSDDSSNAEPTAGGTVHIATLGDISTMLPWKLRGSTDRQYGCIIFEKLLNIGEDGEPVPFLAEEYTADVENLTYTFKIRQGVTFHDGSELNAEVVKWNLDMYKAEGAQSNAFLSNMDHVEVADEYTVVMHLSQWDALIPYYIAREGGCGYIASQAAYEENGEEWFAENPVSTAPFRFVSWERDVGVTLEKYPDYWQGEPKLDGVKFDIYSTALVAQAAFENGDIHAMMMADLDMADTLKAEGFSVTGSAVPSTCHTICFEAQNPDDPFSDILVRQAAAYAIDEAGITAALLGEDATVTNQYAKPGSAYYNDEIEGYPYNPDKAKELLAEAGYANGFDTVLYYNSTTDLPANICQVVAEQLGQVGINVTLSPVDNAAYSTMIDGWDGGLFLHSGSIDSGTAAVISGSYARNATSGIGLNSFVHPEELYVAIETGQSSSPEECIENFKLAQKIIFQDEVMLKAIAVAPSVSITAPTLHDSDIGATLGSSADLWDAWLEQ